MMTFSEVLESAEELPIADQEELVQTLHRRLSEQRRQEIISTVEQARQEHANGSLKPSSVDEIVDSLEV